MNRHVHPPAIYPDPPPTIQIDWLNDKRPPTLERRGAVLKTLTKVGGTPEAQTSIAESPVSTGILPWLRLSPRSADRVVLAVALGASIATAAAALMGFFQ